MGINSKTDTKDRNWRRTLSIFVLVAVVAYAFGEPYLEEWTGLDLPSIRDQSDVAVLEPSESDKSDSRYSTNDQESTAVAGESKANRKSVNRLDAQKKLGSENTKTYLKPTGRKSRLQSPAGLVYGVGGGGEHRVDHVMRHAEDDKSRPVHSVFEGSKDDILRVIDEAFKLVKSNSKRVRSKQDDRLDFRKEHLVDMQRKIGYLGGQRGRRENHPPRSKITLVLDNGKFVVTAYPDK